MMSQFQNSDYIMRMIEQFARALASIITARKAQQHEEAFVQIQHASQLYLESDVLELIKLSPKGIIEKFRGRSGRVDVEKCVVCADLLYEMALISEAKGITELSDHIKMQCLYLYVTAIPMDKQFETTGYLEKVDTLKTGLTTVQFPDWYLFEMEAFEKFISKKSAG